jgi:Xaa-Pro aminopeptidase
MTRTIPVSGKYTIAKVYNAVLRVKNEATKMLVQEHFGNNTISKKWVNVTSELLGLDCSTKPMCKRKPRWPAYKIFHARNIHHMGLDTHDWNLLNLCKLVSL